MRGEGRGHPGGGGPAGLAPPLAQPCREVGVGWVPRVRARLEPGVPGLPGGAGPGPRLPPQPARGSAPPGRRRDERGGRKEGAVRPEGGRGGVRDARGGSPGSRRFGDWRPAWAEGRARRSRGPGKAWPGRAVGGGWSGKRGGDGRGDSFSLPSLYFLKQDVGRPGDVMGSPSPAPRPGRKGEGRGRRASQGAGGPQGGFLSNVWREWESHCET